VPKTSSTLCDQVIFVDRAEDAGLSSDAVQVEIDRFGQRFQRRGAVQGVYTEDPPQDWGLRSAKLRLTEKDYVQSASPRTLVSAAVLTVLKANGVTISQPSFQRRRAFTIWLGKRYDRPAVPPGLLPLAKQIAEVVNAKRNRLTGARVRDVLMQFDESASPLRFSLLRDP
jgi:hypothetical protein